MSDDPKFIAKIQKFYEDMNHKLIESENISMIVDPDFRRDEVIKITILSELMNMYDKIFLEYLYRDKT